MSSSTVRRALLALAMMGAVSAVQEAPAPAVDVAAVELAVNTSPAPDQLLLFDKPGCKRRSDYGKDQSSSGVTFVDFCSDVVVPEKKKSLYIQDTFKDRQVAAYSDYRKTKHGEIQCCGEFLGFIDCGCYDLDNKQIPRYNDRYRHFNYKEKEPECRIKCLRPVDDFSPEYSKYATISARSGYEDEHGYSHGYDKYEDEKKYHKYDHKYKDEEECDGKDDYKHYD